MPLEQAFPRRSRRRERWLTTLDDHGVQYLVLDAFRDHKLLRAARSHPRWTIDFRDGASVLLTRNQALDGTQDMGAHSALDSQGLRRTRGSHNL
jgi:hypothetical protein